MGIPRSGFALAAGMLIAGCATLPPGPSVMVLPGNGKPFPEFRQDDESCRQWAAQQTGASASFAANQTIASGAVIGSAIGAALGAAIGAASGVAGTGAAIGAASGLFMGTVGGANAGLWTGEAVQRRYDNSYLQCMYASGNQIPFASPPAAMSSAPPPPPPPMPPAPAGNPPPPPLGSPRPPPFI